VAEVPLMSVERPGSRDPPEFFRTRQIQEKARVFLQRLGWRADGFHDPFSRPLAGRRENVRTLGGSEGYRGVCANRLADKLARVGGNPCRQINRHNLRARERTIEVANNSQQESLQGLAEPSPENGVDEQRRIGQGAFDAAPLRLMGYDIERPQTRKPFEVGRCVAPQRGRVGEQDDARLKGPLTEQARYDQAIAPVVPAPAQDQNPVLGERREALLQKLDHASAAVLHQRQARHSVTLGRQAVDSLHLRSSQDLHSIDSGYIRPKEDLARILSPRISRDYCCGLRLTRTGRKCRAGRGGSRLMIGGIVPTGDLTSGQGLGGISPGRREVPAIFTASSLR